MDEDKTDAPADSPGTPDAADNRRFDRYPAYLKLQRQKRELERLGLANPYFALHDGVSGAHIRVEGRSCVNFSGYNYLGLAGDPRVARAAKEAIDRYGTSVAASRIVSGERPVHQELEAALADLLGTEDALAFVSGHATNVTVIGCLFGAGDLIVHDALVHNSARQGIALSGARRISFPHEDPDALEEILRRRRREYERALIVVEGVYSMDGDIANLPRYIELKEKYGAFLMVDEAHSLGVLGAGGRGIGEHFGVRPAQVDLWMGTLSKAFASCGGFIAGCGEVVELLKYNAPGFVFSVGLSPPDAAAALAAVGVLRAEPERAARLRARSRLFADLARSNGLDTGDGGAAGIVPIKVGDSLRCMRLASGLLERGVSVQPILFPAVRDDDSRLRFFLSSQHTEEEIRQSVEALAASFSDPTGAA